MVVVTTRRCRSVPPSVVELDYGYGPASRKAHRISQYMHDDQDAIRSASRRHDAALLRNITSRMDTSDYHGLHVPRRARAYSPVTCHITRSGRASSVPRNFRESDYEGEEFFYPRSRARLMEVPRWEDWTPYFYKPITSYVSHQVRHRAGSEPPVDHHVPLSSSYVSPAQRYTTPSVDLAVRQARGALGRLERELSTGWEDPYYYEEEHIHRPVRPYSTSSYDRVHTIPAPRSYSPIRTHYSPLPTRRSRYADIESSLEATYMPETSSLYAGLRSRAAEARSKIDVHKTMMDRYLPVHLGPEKDVGWWHRHHQGGHQCRTLGSVPVKYFVRQSTTPSTTVTKLYFTSPEMSPSDSTLTSPLGMVSHTLRTRIPNYAVQPSVGRPYMERYDFLPLSFFVR